MRKRKGKEKNADSFSMGFFPKLGKNEIKSFVFPSRSIDLIIHTSDTHCNPLGDT